MIYFLIALLFIALIYASFLLLKTPEDFAGAKFNAFILDRKVDKTDYLTEFEEYLLESRPELAYLIGDKVFSRLFVPIFVIFMIALVAIAPLLTNVQLAVPLALIITLAYGSRVFYSLKTGFRSKVLLQLERILRAIRNNLSTGMTLDYAVNNAVKFNMEKPLGPHLQKFIKVSETNFLENFPKWLLSIRQIFKIKELAKSSQLLALELKYSANQEEAFINAVAQVSDRVSANRKQKNTVLLSMFTMDFMVIALFAVLFFVIPNISMTTEVSWWDSGRRPLVVFISAAVIWLAYFITVFIMLRRQN